jgi:uridine kinase
MKPNFIGISGGTGSGKTYLSELLVNKFGKKNITRIELDSYYKDNSNISLIDREKINYDHPESIDRKLLERQLIQLSKGKTTYIPNYNFLNHTRLNSKKKIIPKKIIVIEGVFALYFQEIYKFFDLKIFLNTPRDISFIRRLERDIVHRGRSTDSTIKQYLSTVRPMYDKYIKPTQDLADIILEHNYSFSELYDKVNLLMGKNFEAYNTELR